MLKKTVTVRMAGIVSAIDPHRAEGFKIPASHG